MKTLCVTKLYVTKLRVCVCVCVCDKVACVCDKVVGD